MALAANDCQIIYGPLDFTWEGETDTEVGVVAPNRYDAVLVALGRYSDKIQITSDMFAKLSNESTGGSFWKLAQEFDNPAIDGGTLSYQPTGVNPGFWSTAYGLYGQGNVWYANCPKTLFVSANEDLDAILDGNDLGGGSSSIPSGLGKFTAQSYLPRRGSKGDLYPYLYEYGSAINSGGVVSLGDVTRTNVRASWGSSYDVDVYYDKTFYDFAMAQLDAGFEYFRWVSGGGGTYVIFSSNGDYSFVGTPNSYQLKNGSSALEIRVGPPSDGDLGHLFTYDGGYVAFLSGITFDGSLSLAANEQTSGYYNPYYSALVRVGTLVDPVPETHWPDDPEPTTPTAPELPDPYDHVEPPSEPTYPEVPTPTPTEVQTYTIIDYTALLQEIIRMERVINGSLYLLVSELSSHCAHIVSAISSNAQYLGNQLHYEFESYNAQLRTLRMTLVRYLESIYSRLGVLDSDLGSVTGVLLDIERDLQGLDLSPEITVEGGGGSTDVSGIESLLTQIRNDMANLDRSTGDLVDVSTIETRLGGILTDFDNLLLILEEWPDYPTMPGIDLSEITGELSEWHNDFIGMWDGFGLSFDRVNHNLEDIYDKLRDWGQPSYPSHPEQGDKTIGELTFDKMSELKRKFPFSIPWDIAAMIDLFVAPPKAPVFELPVPLTDEVVEVDMSPLEPVAQVTRRGSLLLFGFALMWSTKRLIWGGPEGV